jgi:hypothetical protein
MREFLDAKLPDVVKFPLLIKYSFARFICTD